MIKIDKRTTKLKRQIDEYRKINPNNEYIKQIYINDKTNNNLINETIFKRGSINNLNFKTDLLKHSSSFLFVVKN